MPSIQGVITYYFVGCGDKGNLIQPLVIALDSTPGGMPSYRCINSRMQEVTSLAVSSLNAKSNEQRMRTPLDARHEACVAPWVRHLQ